jgi:tetratricopeptide (TPR) repeat protein
MNRLVFAALVAAAAHLNAQESHAGHGTPDTSRPILGTIDFPITANPASREAFIRGVLFMHNFHYEQAADAFREAEKLDPANVMAYWGEAMTHTHPVWNEQDTAEAHAVLAKLGASRDVRLARAQTPRERMWLDAAETLYAPGTTKAQRDTAYSATMGKLYASDTTDIEARAFYALSLLGLNEGDRDVATYRKAYELLAPVFKTHPKHPGIAHYLIHAVDDPDHARLGLAAANAYGEIAPTAGHALHMTSHIYLALGRWDDVLNANLRAHATIPNGMLSGHGGHWIHYSYIQLGRYRDADRWLDSMVKQAGSGRRARRTDSWDAAGMMAAANVVDTHRYKTHAAGVRVDESFFNAESSVGAMVDLAGAYFGYAIAALETGNRSIVDSAFTKMEKMRTDAAGDVTKASARGYVEVIEKTLRGYVLWKDRKFDDALSAFRDAAQEEASLPMPFGPPVVIKPPRESAGELLLEMKRPAEARVELTQALARTPQRTSVLLALREWKKHWATNMKAGNITARFSQSGTMPIQICRSLQKSERAADNRKNPREHFDEPDTSSLRCRTSSRWSVERWLRQRLDGTGCNKDHHWWLVLTHRKLGNTRCNE